MIMTVIMSVWNTIWRPIHRRSPPAASIPVNRTIAVVRIVRRICMRIGIAEPSRTVNEIHRPAMPGIICHAISPGTRTRIVASASPRAISATGAVNNYPAHAVGRKIASRISHVNDLRRRMIYINITYIVNRRRRRYDIYLNRTPVAHNPGTSRT